MKTAQLPIGEGQTISQPYIVAFMTERLRLKPHHTVLEIGTGSGYQTAILCHSAIMSTASSASAGWLTRPAGASAIWATTTSKSMSAMAARACPIKRPFDRIMVTAAVPRLPNVLCSPA